MMGFVYFNGKHIKKVSTPKSINNGGFINIHTDNETFKLHIDQLPKILNSLIFRVIDKTDIDKRFEYRHLVIEDYWLKKLLRHGEWYIKQNCEVD